MKRNLPRGVKAMVAGAAPPASMIEGLERLGFDLTHVYGLTQVYGPAVVCVKQAAWESRDDGGCNRLREQGSRKVEAGDRGLEHQDRLNDGFGWWRTRRARLTSPHASMWVETRKFFRRCLEAAAPVTADDAVR